MSATTKATEAKKFAWTDEVYAKVKAAYVAKLASDGVEVASGNDHLLELAKMVGAASEKAVRGKLAKEGDYKKLDKPASQAKTGKIRKEHIVRAIAHTLGLESGEEDIDSLKNGKQDHLAALAEKLGVNDVLQAADKNYSPRPEMVVMSFMQQMGVDSVDLEAYEQELLEAAESEKEDTDTAE